MPDRSWLCHSVPCHFNRFLWLICLRQLSTMCLMVKVLYFFVCHTIILFQFGWYHFYKENRTGTHLLPLFHTTPIITFSFFYFSHFRQYYTTFRHVNRSVRWWPISFLEELFELLRKWLWKIFQLLYGLVVWKDVLLRVWKIPIIAFHWQAYPSRLPEWHDMIPWFIS